MAFDFSSFGGTPVDPGEQNAATPTAPAAPTGQVDLSSMGGQKIDLSSLGGTKADDAAKPAAAPAAANPAPAQSDTSGVTPAEPIAEGDRGAMEGLKRFGKSLIQLPGNVIDAFKRPATPDEDITAEMISRMHNIPKPMALALQRIVIEPMVRQHELAGKYEELSKQHPDQNGDYDGPQHRANMHHIASVFPLVGPIAADMVERYVQGDRSGAVSELLSNIGGGAALDSASKFAVGKVTGKIAKNVEAANTLSKAEEMAAAAKSTATQTAADAATANAQAEAGRPTLDAHAAAEDSLKTAKQNVSKATATENATTAKAAAATKATREATNNLAAEQIADEEKAAAAKKATIDNAATQVKARSSISNAARGAAENALDAINTARGEVPGVEPIDTKAAASGAKSFGDAADVIQAHAKQIYQKLDDVSNGGFTNLREIMKANKQAIYQGDKNAPILQARLEKDMDALFAKHADEVGPNDLKAASAAWRTSKVLEDLHTAVERSISGAPEDVAARAGTSREVIGSQLGKRLNKLLENTPQADIENAIGKEGLNNLYRVADMTSDAAKTAKLVDASRNVAKHLKLESQVAEASKAEAAATAAAKDATAKNVAAKSALAQAEAAERAAAAAKQPTVEMTNKARQLRAKAEVAKTAAKTAEEAAAAVRPKKPSTAQTVISHLTTKSMASAVGASAAHMLDMDPRLGAAAGVMAEQGTRAVLQKMLVSPRVGKMLNDAVSVGANAKVYGPLIAQAIQKEGEANETRAKGQAATK